MDLVTAADLNDLCPGIPADGLDDLVAAFNAHMPHAGITTPSRIAEFMGQLAAESKLQPVTENLNYTAERMVEVFPYIKPAEAAKLAHKPAALAERIYGTGHPEKAHDLGNEAKGDAFKFRGRTPIQLTGKANYAAASEGIGADLVSDPDSANDPDNSVAVACWFWTAHNLNKLADFGDTEGITKKINGGLKTLAARRNFRNKALKIWTTERLTNGRDDEVAKSDDATVVGVQKRLAVLNYPVGDADGKLGTITRSALKAFQEDNGLEDTGEIDADTLAALPDAKRRTLSDGRTEATADDLAAKKDKMASATKTAKTAVKVVGTTGTVTGAIFESLPSPSDAVDHVQTAVQTVQGAKEAAQSVRETLGDEAIHFLLAQLPHVLAWGVAGGILTVGSWFLIHRLESIYVNAKAAGKVL